jgi:AcrR family transcriptional regulator
MISAALELVAEGGPQTATVSAIARRVGAPTGSFYHRFRSRDLLLAELWLTVVEAFQEAFLAELEHDDPLEAGLRAAVFWPRWVREHLLEARLMLLHHRRDFVPGAWPEELVERAGALEPRLMGGVRDLCVRRYGAADKDALRRVRFALLDVPYGSLRPYVQAGRSPPAQLDELIAEACRAVLAG